jgi:serine protease
MNPRRTALSANRLRLDRITAAAIAIAFGISTLPAFGQSLQPRSAGSKKSLEQLQAMPQSNQVVVKFREGMRVRLSGGRLTGLTGGQVEDLAGTLRAAGVPAVNVRRLHTRPEAQLDDEREAAQRRKGKQLADLNLYYIIDVPPGVSAAQVANRLNGLDVVEFAEPAPVAQRLPNELSCQAPCEEVSACEKPPRTPHVTRSPDFSNKQGYKDDAPQGIGVPNPRVVRGSDGARMKFVDLEYSWQLNHEDLQLPASRIVLPSGHVAFDPFSSTNHGTAVLGELVAKRNGYGVTGIVPAAVPHAIPWRRSRLLPPYSAPET